jgi:TolA-binding protein
VVVAAVVGLFASGSTRADEDSDYAFAFRLYEEGDYETSKDEFDRFRATYPNSGRADDALFLTAEAARNLDKHDEAIRRYRLLLHDYPDSPLRLDALHGIAPSWFREGKFEESILAFEEVYKQAREPNVRAAALYYQGEAYYNLGNYPRALQAYDALLRDFPSAPEAPRALYGSGWALFQTGRYRDAYDALRAFLERHPTAPEAPEAAYRAAESLFLAEEWDSARSAYEAFVATYDKDAAQQNLVADARLRIGQCLFREGRTDEGRQQFERVIQRHPTLDAAQDAQYWIAEVLFEQKQFQQAIYEYERLLTTYPEGDLVDDARYGIGRAYFALSDFANALKAFEAVAGLPQSSLRDAATWYVGESRRMRQEFNTAILWYRRVAATSDYADDALFGQGYSYMELRDFDNAIATYRALLENRSSPLYRDGLYHLGTAYFRAGQFAAAAGAFGQFLAEPAGPPTLVRPDDALYWQLRSVYELQDYAQTATVARLLLQEHPQSQHRAAARFFLAESLYWQRDYAGARAEYQAVLEQAPQSEWAQNARYHIGWTYFGEAQATDDAAAQSAAYTQAFDTWQRIADDPKAPPEFAARSLYDVGIVQLNLRKFDDSIRTFADLRRRFPTSEWADDAQYRIGWTLYHKEEYDSALQALDGFLQDYASSTLVPHAILVRGNSYFKRSRYQEAIAEYRRVSQDFPTTPAEPTVADGPGAVGGRPVHIREEAQYQIGESFYNLRDYPRAIEAYQTLQRLYPTSRLADDAQYAIAAAYQLQGKDTEALAAYQALVRDYPESDLAPETLRAIGVYYFEQKDYQQAITHFQGVITRYPDAPAAPQAQYDIGRSYYQLRSYPQAVQAFEKVAGFPQAAADVRASALYYAAWSLRDENNPRRDPTRGAEVLRSLIQTYPKSTETARAYLLIAEIQKELKQPEQTVQTYRELIRALPDAEEAKAARIDLGNALILLRRYQDALDAFAPIADNPNRYDPGLVVRAQLGKGDALRELRRYEDAARAYLVPALMYAEHSPIGALQGLFWAGFSYEQAKRSDNALRWYDKAVRDYQSHPDSGSPQWKQFLDSARERAQAIRKAQSGR